MSLDAGVSLADDPDTDSTAMTQPVTMTRRDPELNKARFYRLWLEPTLFQEVSIIRNWGRIGTRGQSKVATFPKQSDARAYAALLERQKRRRRYL